MLKGCRFYRTFCVVVCCILLLAIVVFVSQFLEHFENNGCLINEVKPTEGLKISVDTIILTPSGYYTSGLFTENDDNANHACIFTDFVEN